MKFLLMNDLGNWRPRSKRQYMSIFHCNWCYWLSYRTDLIINGCNIDILTMYAWYQECTASRHALWHEDQDGMLIQFGDGTFYSVHAGENDQKQINLKFWGKTIHRLRGIVSFAVLHIPDLSNINLTTSCSLGNLGSCRDCRMALNV